MPSTRPPYPAEFKQQLVELVQTGRTPAELSREFGVSAQSIATWVARATSGDRRTSDELSVAERDELKRLRRQVKQLQQERDILAKATAWFAGKSEKTSGGFTNS